MNEMINAKLQVIDPGWRTRFADAFVGLRDDIFTGVNFGPSLAVKVLEMGGDEEYLKLFLAKTEVLIGTTSCGWFFGGTNTPERDIPANMIKGIQGLFPEEGIGTA